MRWIISLQAAGLMALVAPQVQADVMSCAEELLQASPDRYQELQVTPEQAQELESIQSRRQVLQLQLEQVRAAMDQVRRGPEGGLEGLDELERQEVSLVGQLENEKTQAADRLAAMLTAWQRQRCALPSVEVPPVLPQVVRLVPPWPEPRPRFERRPAPPPRFERRPEPRPRFERRPEPRPRVEPRPAPRPRAMALNTPS